MEEPFVHVFLLPLGSQLQEYEWGKLAGQLTKYEQKSIEQFFHWQDKQRALYSKILMRFMVRHVLGHCDVMMHRNTAGRPYLVDELCDLNLSHSGDWVVGAVSNVSVVGIDIEKIANVNDTLLSSVLSREEKEMLLPMSRVEKTKAFYELWTMKEAIYKTGLFPDLKLECVNTFDYKKVMKVHTFYADANHPVTVCWNYNNSIKIKLIVLSKGKLLEEKVVCH